MSRGVQSLIPLAWRAQLDPIVDWTQLEATLSLVRRDREVHAGRVYPPALEVFQALEMTPVSSVRAVILGQDPYHRSGQAHGLAFSLRPSASPFPGSLINILDEVERDYGPPVNRNGSLIPWAQQGVLVLNAALTVIEREPGTHLRAWTPFTDAVIRAVSLRASPVVFMLWGREAEAKMKRALIDTGRHPVQIRSHPSGRSARHNFRRTGPFREANEALKADGLPEIDWSLPLGDSPAVGVDAPG